MQEGSLTNEGNQVKHFTRCDRLQKKVLVFDIYKEPFYFLMSDGVEGYRTLLGSCLSIWTFVVLLLYAMYKIIALAEYEDYQINKRTLENFFPIDQTITSTEHKFWIAAGVTAFDGQSEVIEDPAIGTIKFYMKVWDSYRSQKD